jgi:hypothetical protein
MGATDAKMGTFFKTLEILSPCEVCRRTAVEVEMGRRVRPWPAGCFVEHCDARIAGAGEARGPLAGKTFAVKDNFDVKGFATGAGSPAGAYTRSHFRST